MATKWGEVKLCKREGEHTVSVANDLSLKGLRDRDGWRHALDMVINDVDTHMQGAPHTGGTVSLNQVFEELGL